MLVQPHLLQGDQVKDIGFELRAIDLARHEELATVAKQDRAALRVWLDANVDDGPALTRDERKRLEDRLDGLRAHDMPALLSAALIWPIDFELRRTAFLRDAAARDDDALTKFAPYLPDFACRERLQVSQRVYETLLWLLVPPLRTESPALVALPGWVACTGPIDVAERARILNAADGLRALAGRVKIAGLEPYPYGFLRHVPNVTPADMLADAAASFEAALPTDLAALLPEWRRTFPAAYHGITMRFALSDLDAKDTRAYADELRRNADWYFVDAMSEMHRVLTKMRSFWSRASRRGWAVVTSDGFDA